MNLALSALLIILFLLPALFFRIGFSFPVKRHSLSADNGVDYINDLISRNITKAFSKLNFTETVFLFSIVPIALHLISIIIISVVGCRIDYGLLLNIFSGKHDIISDQTNLGFQHKLISFLIYTFTQTLLGLLCGWLIARAIGDKKWLLRILMGNNIWFKLFSGASLSEVDKKQLSFIVVEVLTQTKEVSVIYSGWLKNYDIVDQTDTLAYLTLHSAMRRDMRAFQITHKDTDTAPTVTSTHYDTDYGNLIIIPGHNLTIAGKEIINVNVTYMKYEIDPDNGERIAIPIGGSITV